MAKGYYKAKPIEPEQRFFKDNYKQLLAGGIALYLMGGLNLTTDYKKVSTAQHKNSKQIEQISAGYVGGHDASKYHLGSCFQTNKRFNVESKIKMPYDSDITLQDIIENEKTPVETYQKKEEKPVEAKTRTYKNKTSSKKLTDLGKFMQYSKKEIEYGKDHSCQAWKQKKLEKEAAEKGQAYQDILKDILSGPQNEFDAHCNEVLDAAKKKSSRPYWAKKLQQEAEQKGLKYNCPTFETKKETSKLENIAQEKLGFIGQVNRYLRDTEDVENIGLKLNSDTQHEKRTSRDTWTDRMKENGRNLKGNGLNIGYHLGQTFFNILEIPNIITHDICGLPEYDFVHSDEAKQYVPALTGSKAKEGFWNNVGYRFGKLWEHASAPFSSALQVTKNAGCGTINAAETVIDATGVTGIKPIGTTVRYIGNGGKAIVELAGDAIPTGKASERTFGCKIDDKWNIPVIGRFSKNKKNYTGDRIEWNSNAQKFETKPVDVYDGLFRDSVETVSSIFGLLYVQDLLEGNDGGSNDPGAPNDPGPGIDGGDLGIGGGRIGGPAFR